MSERAPGVALTRKLEKRPKKRRRESGSELVEFNLVLIPMLAMVFLAVDAAWAIYAKASLQQAVREGVRYGVISQADPKNAGACLNVGTENSNISNVVIAFSGGVLQSSNLSNIAITYYSPQNPSTPLSVGQLTPGNIVQVSVTNVSLKLLAPFFVSNLPMTLSASSADVLEGSCA